MSISSMTNTVHTWWDRGPKDLDRPLLLIAGPCVLESPEVNMAIASTLQKSAEELGLTFVFKASFDKANRSSLQSDRGPGMHEGLAELARIRDELSVPVLTDVHEAQQAAACAEVVDILQLPAFLCRQTDLLTACGATGCPINVKKGQFLAPGEMKNVFEKLKDSGCTRMMACERGTFFGYHRLVNDFIGMGDLAELAAEFGAPFCFDVTHSTQLPGGDGTSSGGRPERASLLARAAVAAGAEAVFIECHPDPANARSDAATVQPLDAIPSLLKSLVGIREAIRVSS